MTKTNLFKIDGKPMFAPDGDMGFSFEDLDGSDSGRDEAGVMHRVVVRRGVGTWSFTYSNITDEELAYMESLFKNKAQFTFTHPKLGNCGATVQTTAYRSKFSVSWKNARTKTWRNYKFNIIEC